MRKLTKKTVAIAAGTTLLLSGAGAAYAYWTTTGAGAGTATTGTSAAVIVNQTSAASALYPGTSVALAGNFDNGATAPQYVTAVTATVDTFSLQTDAGKPACTQADFTITGSSNLPGDIPVGLGQGNWSGLSVKMNNLGTNQDNCKGLTVAQLKITYASS